LSNKKQQTAVEWIFNELSRHWNGKSNLTYQQIQDKAKAMNKEQIMDAYAIGKYLNEDDRQFAEQYYNETYNQ
jgi:hypothetical protein